MSDRAIYLVVARGRMDDKIQWVAYWADEEMCKTVAKVLQKEHDEFDEWHDAWMLRCNGRDKHEREDRLRCMTDGRYEYGGIYYDVISVQDDPTANEPEKPHDHAWRVASVVEAWRKRLKLQPFDEYAEWRNRESERRFADGNIGPDYKDRQTGRTTHGLLTAIASARLRRRTDLVIRCRTQIHSEHTMRRAQEIMNQLRITDIRLQAVTYNSGRDIDEQLALRVRMNETDVYLDHTCFELRPHAVPLTPQQRDLLNAIHEIDDAMGGPGDYGDDLEPPITRRDCLANHHQRETGCSIPGCPFYDRRQCSVPGCGETGICTECSQRAGEALFHPDDWTR